MNSRFKKIDSNQTQIVAALRKVGASVQSIASLGKGCPDLLVGFRKNNYLFEVKCHDCPPSAKKLTPDEKRWQAAWRGECYVIDTPQQALTIIGAADDPYIVKDHYPLEPQL